MAAPDDLERRNTTPEGSDLAEMKAQLNNLIDGYRALCTKLDADSGVGDNDYFATLADAGASAPPQKVSNIF